MFFTGNGNKRIGWFLLIILGGILIFFYFLDPEKSALFPKCPLYEWTGFYCPGCGSQRAIHSFLHFRFLEVFHYNLLMYPAGALILYHLVRPFIQKKSGVDLPDILYHPRTPWIILFIVVLFWILRNIPVVPFTWLAPV
jgi:hypothetical protein